MILKPLAASTDSRPQQPDGVAMPRPLGQPDSDDDAAVWLALELAGGSRPSVAPAEWRSIAATGRLRWSDVARLLRSTGPREAALASVRAKAERLLRRGAESGMTAVCWASAQYPPLLRNIPDPPCVLWMRGNLGVLHNPCIAVVGARKASEAALLFARQLGRDLAAAGTTVVSGLAYGVDAAAHEGALDGGASVAVLGTGLDIVYPSQHEALARRLAATGALVSEFHPGVPPRRHHFPRRNRIVSGLVLGVVVVEAGATSGALITAAAALEQGREVMVVPGQPLSGRNRGGHALIKDGAALVEDSADVLRLLSAGPLWLGLSGGGRPTDIGLETPIDPPAAASDHDAGRAGMKASIPSGWLRGEEMDVQVLQQLTARDVPDLLAALLRWELEGAVVRTAEGRFVRR